MTTAAPTFVSGLRRHGERAALIIPDSAFSYRELAEQVDEVARALGTEQRRLVLLEAAGDLGSVVGYLDRIRRRSRR